MDASKKKRWIAVAAAALVSLVILWLAGFAMQIGGSLIHLLLVIAVIVLLFQLFTGRRAV